jgi:Flp pilus assembly pilin Flp
MLFVGARAYSFLVSRKDRLASEDGQALVEYALIISFIATVAVGILFVLGHSVANLFTQITTGI